MAWFFVQVWVLCLVAFLLGAGVTWLVFVRPARRDRGVDWPEMPAWPDARPPVTATRRTPPRPAPDREPAPVTDPALSALDGSGRATTPGPGAAANDALDQLGVLPSIPEQSAGPPARAADIPAQPRPADR